MIHSGRQAGEGGGRSRRRNRGRRSGAEHAPGAARWRGDTVGSGINNGFRLQAAPRGGGRRRTSEACGAGAFQLVVVGARGLPAAGRGRSPARSATARMRARHAARPAADEGAALDTATAAAPQAQPIGLAGAGDAHLGARAPPAALGGSGGGGGWRSRRRRRLHLAEGGLGTRPAEHARSPARRLTAAPSTSLGVSPLQSTFCVTRKAVSDFWPAELAPRGYDGLAWAGLGGVWAGEGFVVRGSGWTGVVPQATGWGRRFPARPGEPPRGRVCSRQTQICQEMHENLVITSPEIFYNLVAELFLRMTANATRPTAFPKRERTHLSRIHTLRPPPCPAPHPVPSGSR